MDKKRSILNVSISIGFKIILLFTGIITRRMVIQHIGNEANGINSLYLSIIGFLSIAELGVGSAISFSMYKPIIEGDKSKVVALYCLYRKLYLLIGGLIFLGGLVVLPFLPSMTKGYTAENVNLYATFLTMLISVVLTYLFSAKTSLINAYKDNYITTTISSVGLILQQAMQIAVTIIYSSFQLYLLCRIFSVLVQWAITDYIAKNKYRDIINKQETLDAETKKEVSNNIGAMFMHKIGGVLVNTADSIIISTFVGVVILGKYSNYTSIMTSMTEFLKLFFTPLIAVVGHMYAKEGKETAQKYFSFFHSFNFCIGVVFYLGYYAIIDNIVSICFGDNLQLSRAISFVITVNYFIQFMRQSALLFRSATGTFYNDRWKPLFEGIFNVIFSVLFVKVFPEELQVVGVIVATIATNILICHVVEPYVLFKHAFNISAKGFYFNNYLKIIVFVVCLLLLQHLMIANDNTWVELLSNGSIAVAIGFMITGLELIVNKNYRQNAVKLISRK